MLLAVSVVADGVRLITEQRTTGSGDGVRDGFGCGVRRTRSSLGTISSGSAMSFGATDGGRCVSLLGLCGVGYDLSWAGVRT